MSDSSEPFGTIQQSQSQKETTANTKLNAASPASYFGFDEESSAGLRWYYHSAVVKVAGVRTRIPAGYLDLTPSAPICYIEHTLSGVVSFNTVGFTAGSIPDYRTVTGASTISSYEDLRMGATAEEILAELGIDSLAVITDGDGKNIHITIGSDTVKIGPFG